MAIQRSDKQIKNDTFILFLLKIRFRFIILSYRSHFYIIQADLLCALDGPLKILTLYD